MSQALQTTVTSIQESADAVLARNLVTARVVAGITQQELAEAAGISRATIAQIETGYSDPRLSTIVELARAMELPPIWLLIGLPEVRALSQILDQAETDRSVIDPRDVARMRQYVATGMLKDRVRAAVIGAESVESFVETELAKVSAAIFSAFIPGKGTEIGALLGKLLAETNSGRGRSEKTETLVKTKS